MQAWNLSTGCEHTFAAGQTDCSACVGCQACRPAYDGCQSQGTFHHSVIDRTFDGSSWWQPGGSRSMVNDSMRKGPPSSNNPRGCGTDFVSAPTGLAVQRSPGSLLFVAHAFLNELRVFHQDAKYKRGLVF